MSVDYQVNPNDTDTRYRYRLRYCRKQENNRELAHKTLHRATIPLRYIAAVEHCNSWHP